MSTIIRFFCPLLLVVVCASTALAGAELKINEEAKINLGFRLQTLYLTQDRDLDGDGDFESHDDFKIRRARLRLGADVTKQIGIFLQTEFSEDAAAGGDVRMIDAFVQLKPHKLANIFIGENMAPGPRQTLTSSGALLALDRPGITYKSLTWGARAVTQFANTTYADADSGLRGDVDVRDTGITLFGTHSFNAALHVKYYLGIYDGIQQADADDERVAGRLQVNFFEAEEAYYELSTYLGKKKTVALGAAFDRQASVAADLAGGSDADYALYSVDLFADYPLGPGSVTFEAAYTDLDLDGATALDVAGDGSRLVDARQAQGDGYYLQAGYYINNMQPWAEYESWEAAAASGKGSYDAYRVGFSYFLAGHNANLKIGYEKMTADALIGTSREDSIETFAAGLFITY
ncbi:MAG TPA: hypothetical protein VGA63_02065 [Geopsychrobacteraceae bacterium]